MSPCMRFLVWEFYFKIRRDDGSKSIINSQNFCAPDLPLLEFEEDDINILQRELFDFRSNRYLGCQVKILSRIPSAHVCDTLDFLFHPKIGGIIQLQEVILVYLFLASRIDHESPARLRVLQSLNGGFPYRRCDNDTVQFLWRFSLDVAYPNGSEFSRGRPGVKNLGEESWHVRRASPPKAENLQGLTGVRLRRMH